MYVAISKGLSRNLFHTSSMAITIFSSSARGRSLRISFCERLHASRYEVCGFTTAGTSSTASDPQSLALCRDVRIPARLFSTTEASLDDSGYFQWSMFITESMRTFAASAAFLIATALRSSGVVGACTTSKPTSRTILKRSASLSLAGNMSRSTPFLIGRSAGGGVFRMPPDAGEAAKNSPRPHALSPAVPAVVTVDFRNSRRDEVCIPTPQDGLKPCDALWISFQKEPLLNPAHAIWKSTIVTSPQFVQVNLRVPSLAGFQRLFPRDLASRIRGSAGHHARKGGFRALVRLIVKIPTRNALHKRLLFLAVRKFQV